jgi:hypothetical protein
MTSDFPSSIAYLIPDEALNKIKQYVRCKYIYFRHKHHPSEPEIPNALNINCTYHQQQREAATPEQNGPLGEDTPNHPEESSLSSDPPLLAMQSFLHGKQHFPNPNVAN